MPENHGCRSACDAGFTLIELLITLSLLSLLTLALFGSLRFGTRVWEASVSSAATADDVREAQTHLTELIQSAYPKLVIVDTTHAQVDFDGTQQSLTLLAPDRSNPGAMTHETIAIEGDGNDMALEVMRKPELNASGNSTSQILLKGFSEAAFSYFGSATPGDAPAWHDRWQDKTRLPGLVRLHAAFAGRAIWPDLIIAPKIAADISCTFDPLTHFCQGR